jgi:hypothetical protein
MNAKATLLISATFAGLAALSPAHAWPGDGCKFKADRQAQAAIAGAKSIAIRVGAGDLVIHGQKSGSDVRVRGKACAETAALLQKTDVSVVREGDVVHISSVIPQSNKPTVSLLWTTSDPFIDIAIELPQDVPISLEDSSGDILITDIAGGTIRDSSGDLVIHRVSGNLDVSDSSGDIRIDGVGGKLDLDDSSGDINLQGIKGDVLVKSDSSGDINVVNAGANVTVDTDSSGDLSIDGVAGNFTLGAKGSGDVKVHGVRGTVSIPDYKKD